MDRGYVPGTLTMLPPSLRCRDEGDEGAWGYNGKRVMTLVSLIIFTYSSSVWGKWLSLGEDKSLKVTNGTLTRPL